MRWLRRQIVHGDRFRGELKRRLIFVSAFTFLALVLFPLFGASSIIITAVTVAVVDILVTNVLRRLGCHTVRLLSCAQATGHDIVKGKISGVFPAHPDARLVEDGMFGAVWDVPKSAGEVGQYYMGTELGRFRIQKSAWWGNRLRIAISDEDGEYNFGLLEIVPRESGGHCRVAVVAGLKTLPELLPPRESM